MNEKAYEYLNRNRLHHIDMLQSLDRGIADVLYAEEDGVLLYNRPGWVYMFSTESDEAFETMCGLMKDPSVVEIHQTKYMSALRERYDLVGDMVCWQVAYLHKTPPEVPVPSGFEIKPLSPDRVEFVAAHYEQEQDIDYLRERIEAGMLGAFKDGEPVGFIGTHSEGSMGILQILPEYQHQGLGIALEAAMIRFELQKGHIPYGQLFTNNARSRCLQEKIGMTFADGNIAWMFKDE
ncbi:MAG: GNAT family N-acetyltransferase [Oscillospiraceae bacterium]|jgi:GNAT superfamily N-acetyltransferase